MAYAAALPFDVANADLVVAFMSLQDIDDIAAVREAARVLKPRGKRCLAIPHPINSTRRFAERTAAADFVISGGYHEAFDYSDNVERAGLTMSFHSRYRPLQDYFAALVPAGLVVGTPSEPSTPDRASISESNRRWQRGVTHHAHPRASPVATERPTETKRWTRPNG